MYHICLSYVNHMCLSYVTISWKVLKFWWMVFCWREVQRVLHHVQMVSFELTHLLCAVDVSEDAMCCFVLKLYGNTITVTEKLHFKSLCKKAKIWLGALGLELLKLTGSNFGLPLPTDHVFVPGECSRASGALQRESLLDRDLPLRLLGWGPRIFKMWPSSTHPVDLWLSALTCLNIEVLQIHFQSTGYGCESKRFGIEQVLVDIPFNTLFNTLVQYPCSINILLQF